MIKHQVYISPNEVTVDGKALAHNEKGSALLTELYRNNIGDYPKFFKMDTLSKLGFIASELLLNIEGNRSFEPREDRAVILFNRNASLQADTHYQSTIQDPEHFFPSPAAFVYTLPNIVTGEIAIRNKYFGETSFIVIDDYDDQIIMKNLDIAFQDPVTTSIIGGWVDCSDEEHFEARIFLMEK
jgi:3-oxoacyl-[acyl-carrier-protein] synthase-1